MLPNSCWAPANGFVRTDMQVKVFQVDLVDVDFEDREIYADAACFFIGCFLAKIEEDGDILPLHRIRLIPPSDAESVFEVYRTHGAFIETLVASAKPSPPSTWKLPEKLPGQLTDENVKILKSLMTENRWDHYICMAQTQMLIGTVNNEFYRSIRQGKYASSIETEDRADFR